MFNHLFLRLTTVVLFLQVRQNLSSFTYHINVLIRLIIIYTAIISYYCPKFLTSVYTELLMYVKLNE